MASDLPDFERVVASLDEALKHREPPTERACADALALLREYREILERHGWHSPDCQEDPSPECSCGWTAARERLGLR